MKTDRIAQTVVAGAAAVLWVFAADLGLDAYADHLLALAGVLSPSLVTLVRGAAGLRNGGVLR